MTTFMPPPPAATFLAFHPQDNNIIAIGMDDSTIQIYNVRVDEVWYIFLHKVAVFRWLSESCFCVQNLISSKLWIALLLVQVKSKLKGHSKRITGLAFSHVLNVLVSSGADAQVITTFCIYIRFPSSKICSLNIDTSTCFGVVFPHLFVFALILVNLKNIQYAHVLFILFCVFLILQLCVWSSDGWEKQKARYLQVPAGRTPTSQSDTRVQFHQDQIHFLVVHETQLAIYETTKLDCVKQVHSFT